MLTDPNALAAKAAEHAYCAGNLVTCDGYYEFDLDAAQAAIAAVYAPRLAELEAEVARWKMSLIRAESDLHLIALDGGIGFILQKNAKLARDNIRAALGASHDA